LRARLLQAGAALLIGAAIAAGAVGWVLWPAPRPSPAVSRFTFPLPEGQTFTSSRVVALSPDGTRLVYVANVQLYLRNLHDLTSAPIPGTEGSAPNGPVFSPDGQWVAFHSRGTLKKVPVMGGTPVLLSVAENPSGATWEDGRILLAQAAPPAIIEIPENGGAPRDLVTLNEDLGERARSPQLVAGGRSVLFTLLTGGGEWDDASVVVQDLATGQRTVLLQGGTDARALPTGHLVYTRAGTMFAVPFDETRQRVIGGPVPVQQGIETTRGTGVSQVAWSASGTLAIARGAETVLRPLFWHNGKGQQERTGLPPRNYGVQASALRLSPDGSRLAVTVFSDDVLNLGSGTATEILVADLRRGTHTRLSNTGQATSPVWTPGGQRVCYRSAGDVFCQAADGRGAAELTFKVDGLVNVRPFSPDGTRMLLETRGPGTRDDISLVTIGPPAETRPLLNTRYSETAPAVSPDGRWLAYVSDESGRAEVYVRPFPAVDGGLWPISTGGGAEPRWAPNGRQLFFTLRVAGWTTPGVLMSVPIQAAGSTFIAGQPTEVLKIPAQSSLGYDVGPDGRFLFHITGARSTRSTSGEATRQEIIVVQNWFEELKARVPTAAAR
jgi:serine/threonine-protein kinase